MTLLFCSWLSFNFCGYNRMNIIYIFWPDHNLCQRNYLRVIKTLSQPVHSHLVNIWVFSSRETEVVFSWNIPKNRESRLYKMKKWNEWYHCSVTEILINTNKYWAVPHGVCPEILSIFSTFIKSNTMLLKLFACLYIILLIFQTQTRFHYISLNSKTCFLW